MKKKIFFILIISLIFIISFDKKILSYFFSLKLSKWTEHQVDVRISELKYVNGKIEIDKFIIRNKNDISIKIFDTNYILIDFEFTSLFKDLLIIDEVILKQSIFYFNIQEAISTSGIKILKDNLNLIEKKSPKIYPVKKKDKNFLILDLKIKNLKVDISYYKNDQNLEVFLPDISFSKVGNSGIDGGESFQHYKDVLKLIVANIYYKIPDYNLRKLIKKNYRIK